MPQTKYQGLPLLEFTSKHELRSWMLANATQSPGIWVRVFKTGVHTASVTFEDLLDQGLCFGWSESLRHKGDDDSYYQKFTPRRTLGTTSRRNLDHVQALIASGEMTDAGRRALKL